MRSVLVFGLFLMFGCAPAADHDIILRGGTVYDGTGQAPYVADIAVSGDTIAAIGDLGARTARSEFDVSGLAVSPGFINMLSWAIESLIRDGRSQSDIRQGITLEVFGEGQSMGPLNERMKAARLRGLIDYAGGEESYRALMGMASEDSLALPWTSLDEYLEFLVQKGVSPNVASFVGATTVRIHELGYEDRPPTPVELGRMQALVRAAMEDGALGLGSALVYAPAFYASTEELISLASVVADFGGLYISHIRSEGNRLLESVQELVAIARTAGVSAEIYHLKAAGRDNWSKLDTVISLIEAVRGEGLAVSADMYTYTAGATGLDAAMPPDIQEGGFGAWKKRLEDPEVRARLEREMNTRTDTWENLYLAAGAEGVIFSGFRTEALRRYVGRTLADVAAERGTSPATTAMDLVIEDSSRVEAVYFLMSDENVRRKLTVPWVSLGTDAASLAPEGPFLDYNPHPRAYGTFPRLLGRYVRDEGVLPLEEAVRRITSLPATNLKIRRRGLIRTGYFADLVVFDPVTIQDHATFDDPHHYSTGVIHVLVNGTPVLVSGEHTGAMPGRVVRGPGWGADRISM